MSQKDLSDEDLEEELDKVFKSSKRKRNVFKIIREERESQK
jgi:hypothetical protein